MTSRRRPRSERDGPWKEALELFLPEFLALLYPKVHEALDWSRPHKSLDTEFQKLTAGACFGRRLADKLFQVWRKDGVETWLLIHIEVQDRKVDDFAQRMFVYSYRIFDRHRQPVISLAVLCDEDPTWRPSTFSYTICGASVRFRFLTVKLRNRWKNVAALESSENLFVPFVLAHRRMLETRRSPGKRKDWKLRLVEGLYFRGLKPDQVRKLFRLIDWLMRLPEELEREFMVEVGRIEKEKHMPYVTSVERLARQDGREEGLKKGREEGRKKGREEGREEGLREGLAIAVRLRFGEPGQRLLLPRISALQDVEKLRAVAQALESGKTLEELELLVE